MISDFLNNRYEIRNNSFLAFSENAKILENINTYGEGIFTATAAATAKGAAKVATGTAKAAGKAAYNAGSNAAKKFDAKMMSNSVGASIKFNYQRIRTVLKTIIDQIIKMISNLYNAVMGIEKQLSRNINDINNALAKRHPSGQFPDKIRVITPAGLNVIGLDVTQEGSRASIAKGYLETVTKNSLLEGIHFGDEASEKKAIETLVERITGQKRPFDSITPEQFRQDIKSNLYIFNMDELNKKLQNKSKNANTQKAKTFWKKMFGMKQGASVDSKMMQEAMEDVDGNSSAQILTDSLNILKNSAETFVNLKAIEFLRNEDQHLKQIGNDIDKMLETKVREEQQQAKAQQQAQQNTNNNTNNNSSQNSNTQSSTNDTNNTNNQKDNPQPNAQSYFDDKLFKDIVKAGYAEAFMDNVFKNQKAGSTDGPTETAKPNYDKEAYPTAQEMSKDHQLIDVFLVEYSNALNNTIQNITYLYEALLAASKATLASYYSVTR